MLQYGVQILVIETLPNYDSAKSFARRHHGKVFLAGYAQMNDEMLRWGDAPRLDSSDRRTDADARDRYTVTLDQYKVMSWALAKMVKRMVLFPDPAALIQEIIDKGVHRMSAVCKELAFLHFTKVALIAEQDEEQKKFIRKVVKVGIDPHTAYAYYLGCVAMARAFGTGQFILPAGSGSERDEKKAESAARGMPGLPTGVTNLILAGADKRAAVVAAYIKGYLPCAVILSTQIDGDILIRYRAEKWSVLTGLVGLNDPLLSTYDFMRDVVGFDLAGFFTRNSATLRQEIDNVLRALLTPDTP